MNLLRPGPLPTVSGMRAAAAVCALLSLATTAEGAAARPARPSAPGTQPPEAQGDKPERPVAFDRRWLEPYFASGEGRVAAEKYRREDFRAAAAGFSKLARKLGPRSTERAPALYMAAMAQMELEDWGAAGELFEDLHGKYPVLAPYPAYHAARCRLRRGDSEGALAWASKVPEGTVLKAEAELIALDALVTLGKYEDVEREAGRFLERFPAGPRRAEAMYQRAQAMERLERPPADIAALYRKIWSEAPLEVWSRRAEERLERLDELAAKQAAARPAAGKLNPGPTATDLKRPSAAEWLTRAMILFDRNQNEEAEAAFTATLATASLGTPGGSSDDLRCKAEFHRAQSLFKQRQRTRAVPLFAQAQAACKQAGNKDLYAKSIYQGARSLNMIGQRDKALELYTLLEKEAADHSYADDGRLRAAEIHRDEERVAEATALLSEVPERYPQGDQLSEALWRLALQAIRDKKWSEAQRWLDENLRRMPREEIWYAEGRALYWKGRVHAAQGERKRAIEFYSRAVSEYPLSVYALLGLERLRDEAPETRRALVTKLRAGFRPGPVAPGASSWQFSPRPVFGSAEWRRAVELARLGFGGEARRELARLGFSAPDSRDAARKMGDPDDERQDVYWITSVLLDRGRSWAAAHAIPRYTLTEFRQQYPAGRVAGMWRLAYPRAFPEFVSSQSKANRVPEALQWAIMREESAFNPRIESIANALGLTQMLVKTARRFSDRAVSRDTLLDPGRNVELGSKYLSFLLDRYGGLAPLAVASYNAGEGAVDRWLGEHGELPLDMFLETIDFDETRNYTKRVLSSYLTYAWLYDPQRPVPELRFSLKPPRHDRVGRPAGRSPKSRRPR